MNSHKWRTRQVLDVCSECVYVAANDAPDNADYVDSGHAERYAQAFRYFGDEPLWANSECHFSKRPCEFCGDILAGDRYQTSVMQLHTED